MRLKVWDRYLTLCALYDINITFDQFWFEFLLRHIVSEEVTVSSSIYDQFYREYERKHQVT